VPVTCTPRLPQVAYSLIQGVLLVLLMIRFIMLASFQPKLSVIAGTLKLASGDIAYFVFILTVVGEAWACVSFHAVLVPVTCL